MPSEKRRSSAPRGSASASVIEKFPAPVYAETVLARNFADSQKYFLSALLDLHAAHALMLARQKILPRSEARTCLEALHNVDRAELQAAAYDGSVEDFFFEVERRLTHACGEPIAGKLHMARSRNDIDVTLYRMVLREALLGIVEAEGGLTRVLLDLASRHLDTILPAYTHTQPAQPTTLAHYLMASVEWTLRDLARLRAAFVTVNRSPLGACAIATTGFPIDRDYTAAMLGFEGLQRNSYGAIAAVDYLTEAAAAVAVAMDNLGRLVQDILRWCTVEFAFVRLSDGYVQTSSIMPQKRNPVGLEHTRILASRSFAQAKAVLDCVHNTPFGDIVDSEDDLQPIVLEAFADAGRAFRLFAGVMSGAEFQKQRMREAANEHFITATELADTLVRRDALTFRQAHNLVSVAVRATNSKEGVDRFVKRLQTMAPSVIGRRLRMSATDLRRALDLDNFVRVRAITGGPAPRAVKSELARARTELTQSVAWAAKKRAGLAAFRLCIQKESAALGVRYK
jgi:argininosuccinate lyase